jgi:tripartite-type tricarboxylate transporter receptor subunit TctC
MIIQFGPGGNTDLSARKLAELASKILGQPIVVDNKPGGGGVIGAAAVAKAAPDGYTIGTNSVANLIYAPHLRPVPYKTREDFTYIMQYTEFTCIFAVRSDSPWKTLKEFIEEARRNPGKMSYTTPGATTAQHIFVEQVASMEKLKLNHVPVGGGAELVALLLGGHVDAGLTGELIPHVQAGKLRGLAVQGERRLPQLPDIPTFYELGFKLASLSWRGLYAPKGLDPQILKKLYDAFKRAHEDASFKELCITLYLAPISMDPESFKATVLRDFDDQGRILKDLGFVK